MSNSYRVSAETHKMLKPLDPRSVDELENYYRNLSHGSPLARAFSEIAANDKAAEVQQFAELAANTAIARSSAGSDLIAEILSYARELAEMWAHLGHREMVEQIEAHIESSYPYASDIMIEAIISRVEREI